MFGGGWPATHCAPEALEEAQRVVELGLRRAGDHLLAPEGWGARLGALVPWRPPRNGFYPSAAGSRSRRTTFPVGSSPT